MGYVGRFAPSPTGPLHFGSLIAAVASYLDARHVGGKWLLRIEDLDPPRESKTAPEEIIEQLKHLGLNWDGPIFYQGNRDDAYNEVIELLGSAQRVYPCTCSRKQIPTVYPGTCRNRGFDQTTDDYAIRFKLRPGNVEFIDRVFGRQHWDLSEEVGDFIIRRKDGLFAYQLAVVVDDIDQGVNQIVRGVDLLDSTPRQLALYEALGRPPPSYLHVPIVVDGSGNKLSKQAHARPISVDNPVEALRSALVELGQNPQRPSRNPGELLARASEQWQPNLIPRQAELAAPAFYL
ncbi:MAG: tRNA glutamyl-Q(34) synthetase GluQRS [Gammaproteobacteria bacterium]|jgi:glutamyl-Q tRNA(Asp) synthetase|nr:tRNA glutamyl-Q(34) synthetase GluQRS [Gammaproteobacteria bacterium]MBT4492855.1 tRNA glutamyl-Q(34) synthetase GluQRS [Gammaproteobacteria bacterium]MBT7370050.1 tRNA glutamyl-Q(34) synthetase GluQRS [Gammaproteobacteria bacterium]